MKSLTAVVAVMLLLVTAVVLNNWGLVISRMPVDLGIATFDAPLALLLLIALVVVSIAYFGTLGRVRMQAAIESRDLHRELDRARRAVDTAELSRIAELRAYLDREIPQIELKLDMALERLDVRVPVHVPPVSGR